MLEKICGKIGMAHPLTRTQALQNSAFLERLAMSGNVRLAAREIGMKHNSFYDRRSKHAAFAQAWDAAVAAAHARFHLSGGARGPGGVPSPPSSRALRLPPAPAAQDKPESRGAGTDSSRTPFDYAQDEREGCGKAQDERRLRTAGGEAVVVRTRSGKLQLRLAQPGKLTKAAEQAFLHALAATANVRLSAAAAGASPAAFYRRRKQNKAFNREYRLALQMGYERLEMAMLATIEPEACIDDAWRMANPLPIPPMTANQAIQLLYLHQKEARLSWDQPHRRRRRGESDAQYKMRLCLMWKAEQRQVIEEQAVARAMRFEETGDWRRAEEVAPPPLPPLEQVTGWSRADPAKAAHKEGVALFGGWRMRDLEKRMREGKT